MYLARGVLNPVSRDVQRDLADPGNLHRTIMKVFPDHLGVDPRKMLNVLHRVDEDRLRREFVLFVQCAVRPDFSRLPSDYFASPTDDLDFALAGDFGNPRMRPVADEWLAVRAGLRFAFRLRANTTKKIDTKTGADGVRRHGRRVPVRGDEARMAWLARHAEAAGFAIDDGNVRITEVAAAGGRGVKSVTVAGAQFDGILVVRDADLFRAALESGIGPAKAYGFGLLSIAPVR